VTSVAGRTGAVTLSDTDISGLGTLATQSGTFSGTSSGTNTGDQNLSGKQDTLVSATNIKTINSASLLGSGDIVVSASPGGSSGQMQFNNAGAFGGTVAIVYAASGTHVVVTAQSAATIPLCVQGAAAQSGSLFQAKDNVGTTWFAVGAPSGNNILITLGQYAGGGINLANGVIEMRPYGTFSGSFDGSGLNINGKSITFASIVGFTRGVLDGDTGTQMGSSDTAVMLRASSILVGKLKSGHAYFGNGETNAIPATYTINGTGGAGTNIAGAGLKLAPGKSTGNATPAKFTIQRTVALGSGTTLQSLVDGFEIDGNTTAGETPMLLLDITAGTMRRVSIGVADSGGVGFRVLRIPN